MSQISSQALDPDWVSVSLVKFSHNTSPYGSKTYIWNHITARNDLDFVIRNARFVDKDGKLGTRVIMKVTAGADVMETQDLLELVRFCQQFDASTGAEHPVEVAIKSPFLAMRYPKTVNTVRRFQVKFRSHDDYHKIYTILNDLGLPIREPATPSNPPPPPSPAPSLAPSTASSHTLIRPSSAIGSISNYHAGSASSPLKPEFKIPPRPNSTMSEGKARADDPPRISRPFSTQFDNSTIVPTPAFSRVNSFHEPTMQNSQIFVSQVDRELQTRCFSHPASQASDHAKIDVHPRTSLYVDQLQSLRKDVSERVEKSADFLSASPFFALAHVPNSGGEEEYNQFEISKPKSLHRPASTPVTSTIEDYCSMSRLSLPPRRILPFPNPVQSSKTRTLSPTNPSQVPNSTSVKSAHKTGTIDDDLSTPASKTAPKKRVAQRKAPASKLVDNTSKAKVNPDDIIISAPEPVAEEPSPLAVKSAAMVAVARPSSTPLGLISKVAPQTKKRAATPARPSSSNKSLKMFDGTTQTEEPADRQERNVQRPVSRPETRAIGTTPESSSLPPLEYLEAIDAFVDKHKSRPPPKELWETPGWADADDEHRHMLVDNFICENLDNQDFLKLCEDMGTSWRRIGLGF